MKNKKIIIVIIIIIIIALMCIAIPFIKPIKVEGKLIPYNYTIHGTYISVDKYTGGSHDVNIPAYIWLRPVKEIGFGAFESVYFLEAITIPDTIEKLDAAFYECINLKHVEFGENVKDMDKVYFGKCWDLKEIVIPEAVERLRGIAFENCTSLESVTICNPDLEFTNIPFDNWDLDGLTLRSEKGSAVEAYAKENDIKFEEVDVSLVQEPKKNVGEGGKEGDYTYKVLEDGTVCLLKYFGTEKHVTLPSEIAGKKVTMTLATFKDYRNIQTVTIPDTIVHIGDATFMNAYELKKVYGGEGVEKIDWKAFYWCNQLEELPKFSNLKEIGSQAFVDCADLEHIEVGENLKKIGYYGLWMCKELENVELPNGIEEIQKGAFKSCYGLDELEIPASVTYIGEDAFPYVVEDDGTIIGEGFRLIVEEGSYAETYAMENEIPYKLK